MTTYHALSDDNNIKTYRRLRKAIGYLGIGLPISLLLFSWIPFFNTTFQSSISAYYYTHLRELFTGVLCAVGLFLIRYQGTKNDNFWKNDSMLTNVAGFMAFAVALFPTSPSFCDQKTYTIISSCDPIFGWIHYGFAAALFSVLAIISINVFTIGQEQNNEIPISIFNENHIYKLCGYLMIIFIVLIPIFGHFEISPYSTLIFESLSLVVFGISWLVKGRALGDGGELGKKVYREIH